MKNIILSNIVAVVADGITTSVTINNTEIRFSVNDDGVEIRLGRRFETDIIERRTVIINYGDDYPVSDWRKEDLLDSINPELNYITSIIESWK